ncbi:uncharacterized protein V1510DRAFT_402467 [Dipodascopsis tothii]|uniref:uncharacterized protein n=1 Tax=Dipodascopsis tothii TaxID=44089 RepID=UPI0034CD9B76
MSANLDKSLDEIISQNPRQARGGARRGGRRGGAVVAGGAIRKTGTNPARPQTKAAVKAPSAPTGPKLDEQNKIIISNLPFDVQENAIKEYFSLEIGPVKKCTLNYNAKGQSTGVVNMIFAKPGDAARACKRFNGTPIDGGKKVMQVEMVFDPNRKSFADRLQARPEPKQGAAKGRAVPARKGVQTPAKRGGKTATARQRRPKKTVEELDAEMADYFVQGGQAPAPAAAAPAPVAAAPVGDIPL